MRVTGHRIRPSLYRDSVALMQLSTALLGQPCVTRAMALMATPANLDQVAEAGLVLPTHPTLAPHDLLILVEAEGEDALVAALDWAEGELLRPTAAATGSLAQAMPTRTIAEVLRDTPSANIAFIAVPGPYAAAEATKALKAGLHVVLFSSGVSLADEARLKRFAAARSLLMLGAECGTAIIGGVPFGFANAVRRGPIGLVAASGTGLQELTCLIDRWGGGVSHAIGVGGRDLSEEVAGTMMLAGLRLLLADPDTEAVVLLSKPPAPSVAACIIEAAQAAPKPLVLALLGADLVPIQAVGLTGANTLEQAARCALAAVGIVAPTLTDLPVAMVASPRRFVRGLFAGGTLCAEATLILKELLGSVVVPDEQNPLPAQHTCLDLGDEMFTIGRPHPMIDARLRSEYLARALRDPQAAVVLLDIVLGYGADADPSALLLATIAELPEAERPRIVAYVCGTPADPQGLAEQVARLQRAGVVVAETNAQAARLAAQITNQLVTRNP